MSGQRVISRKRWFMCTPVPNHTATPTNTLPSVKSNDWAPNWSKLPQIAEANINQQLFTQNPTNRKLEVIRTLAFTSMRPDTSTDSIRHKMISDMYSSNFEVHKFVTEGLQEKCVDINLAVEMLYMATIPDAYDVAIIITGDKDFIPALQKTRMKGKRVAIMSIRSSCSADLLKPELNLRDFEIVWLDDYLEQLLTLRAGIGREATSDSNTAARQPDIVKTAAFLRANIVDNLTEDDDSTGSTSTHPIHKENQPASTDTAAAAAAAVSDDDDNENDVIATALAEYDNSFGDITDARNSHESSSTSSGRMVYGTSVSTPTSTNSVDNLAVPTDFEKMTVALLRNECRARNLTVRGIKSVVIARLKDNARHTEVAPELQVADHTLGTVSLSTSSDISSAEIGYQNHQSHHSNHHLASDNIPSQCIWDIERKYSGKIVPFPDALLFENKSHIHHNFSDMDWMWRLITLFLQSKAHQKVNIRDLGRWLNGIQMRHHPTISVNSFIKERYTSLASFLHTRGHVQVDKNAFTNVITVQLVKLFAFQNS